MGQEQPPRSPFGRQFDRPLNSKMHMCHKTQRFLLRPVPKVSEDTVLTRTHRRMCSARVPVSSKPGTGPGSSRHNTRNPRSGSSAQQGDAVQKHALELSELYGMKDTRTQLVKVCLQLQRRPRTATDVAESPGCLRGWLRRERVSAQLLTSLEP